MSATPLADVPPEDIPGPRELYDSGRGIRYSKPRLRGWMHLVVFEVSLVVGTAVIAASSRAVDVASMAVYAGSVSGLFGVSALYHRGNWGPAVGRVMQRLDHAMIFVLIAGTATPCFVIGMPGPVGLTGIVVLWSLTLVALVAHLAWMGAPEKLVGGVFIGLGCAAGVAVPAVWIRGGVAAGVLMVVGGLSYIVGAVGYHLRRPDPAPTVFGYHEVFHTYVSIAAICQFVAVCMLLW